MRRLNIVIESCSKCPYMRYDCSMSYDIGYDCNHPDNNRRLLDDDDLTKIEYRNEQMKGDYTLALQEYKLSLKTLFPIEPPKKPELQESPLDSIPDSCPLEWVNKGV